MAKNRGSATVIAIFLASILLLSAILIPANQEILTKRSMMAKGEEADFLGANESELNPIKVDIKVQKITDLNAQNEIWYNSVRVFVGNLVGFKVTLSNVIEFDLVNIRVINSFSSDVLSS